VVEREVTENLFPREAAIPSYVRSAGTDGGVKTIVMSRRRPELTRDAFRDYYEARHVPLVTRHARFTKYVRNHLVAPSDAEFDVVLEFWMVDAASVTALDRSLEGEVIKAHADEFIGPERYRAVAEESLLAGPSRKYEAGRVQKYALLLNRRAYAAESDFIADIRDWGRRLAEGARAQRVTLDVVRPAKGGSFPANAMLWLWLDRGFEVGLADNPPGSIEVAGILTLDAYETPGDKLPQTP
jgi:hypothetical protein